MTRARELARGWLAARLPAAATDWLDEATREIAALPAGPGQRFPALLALASRRIPRGALAPDERERAAAHELVPGWNPERWTLLDAVRAVLVLARKDLATPEGTAALEDCFQYADMGELCALYRVLALLPNPERYVWRAGEGCRSSLRAVYEAAACDTPFPFRHFDAVAWRQLVIKAVFVGAPLWRVHGLDQRLDAELARMALDLVDERRAAGRHVQPELWLCVGTFGGPRAEQSLARELAGTWAPGRRAAALALARAGHGAPVRAALTGERDPLVRATMESALQGHAPQGEWQDLHGEE